MLPWYRLWSEMAELLEARPAFFLPSRLQPLIQPALRFRCHAHKPQSRVALSVRPAHLGFGFDRRLAVFEGEHDIDDAGEAQRLGDLADSNSGDAHIDAMCLNFAAAAGPQKHWAIELGPKISMLLRAQRTRHRVARLFQLVELEFSAKGATRYAEMIGGTALIAIANLQRPLDHDAFHRIQVADRDMIRLVVRSRVALFRS